MDAKNQDRWIKRPFVQKSRFALIGSPPADVWNRMALLSPSIHKFDNELIYSGLSAE